MNPIPGPKLPANVNVEMDHENAFLLYSIFCGDAERTAHACGVRVIDIARVADAEGWNEKLKGIIALKQSSRPGDIERAINRALNFSQCHRMRMFIEKIITRLTGLRDAEVEEYLFTSTPDKNGDTYKKLTTRAIADLTSALEKTQALTYLALGDTVQDRSRRKEDTVDDGAGAGELHVQIAKAMSERRNSLQGQLFEAQLAVASNQIAVAQKPTSPHDNDDH